MNKTRRRLTLRERVLAAFVGVAAILIVVNLVSLHIVKTDLYSEIESQMTVSANSIASSLPENPSANQVAVFLATRVDPSSVYAVRLRSGDLLHSGPPSGWSVLDAAGGVKVGNRALDGWQFYTVHRAGGPTVTVGQSLAEVATSAASITLEQVLATLVALALLTILSAWVISIGVHPFTRIAEVARRISGGERGQRVDVPGQLRGTEYADVADALNTMVTGFEELVEVEAALNEELRRFVADAGHELRTPLTSISGYAQLLESGSLDSRSSGEALGRIRSECARMTRVVEDLTALARLEGSGELRYERFNLTELVSDIVADHRVIDSANLHPVHIESPGGAVVVDGDVDKISQVVINLLANLRAHTPEGTGATLRLSKTAGAVCLSYCDNGPGVDDPSKIFTRFWQADPGRRGSGSGLGMAIVEAAVRAHGGEVEARANSPRGLCIVATLPTLH